MYEPSQASIAVKTLNPSSVQACFLYQKLYRGTSLGYQGRHILFSFRMSQQVSQIPRGWFGNFGNNRKNPAESD